MQPIDNTCLDDTEVAGASVADLKEEKLHWRDVLALTEFIRPGTLKNPVGVAAAVASQ